MGAVYLAQDEVLERPVALKVLLGSLARNVEHVRRFQREARAAARMNHPNIVRIYEAGLREGIPFMAMEYVDGESFDRFLMRNGAMHWRRALEVALQMAQALACAHEQGVVHRDVKPANMLIDKAGRLRLADFGIARVRDQSSGLTDHDAFIGTPEFMSPEQCLGATEIGAASDLFSLGVTLYRMISGRMPFTGSSTASLIASICHDEPPRLNRLIVDVPDDVARLVARLMDKNPQNRPESAVLVAATISELLESDGGTSAISAALDAFIRDQAQPREVELWTTPTPGEKKPLPRRHARVKGEPTASKPGISIAARWAAAVLVVGGLAAAGGWTLLAPQRVEAAPLLGKEAFTMVAPGFYKVALPEGPWQAKALRWLPDAREVLVLLEGKSTGGFAGACGVVRVSAEDGAIHSVVAPASPWRGEPATSLPALALWNNALLRPAPMEGAQGWALVAQNTAMSSPGKKALGLLPAKPLAFASGPLGIVVAVEHAQGQMLYAVREGNAEPLCAEPLWMAAPLLQCSADGQWVYAQLKENGDEALWRVALADGRMEKLAPGAWRALAIAPDENWAIAEDAAGLLHRVTLSGKGASAPLGVGDIAPDAFSPKGDFAVLCLQDEQGAQLAALASTEQQPVLLQRFDGATLRAAAVSSDGRHASAVLQEEGREQLLFADLSSMGAAAVRDTVL